MLKYKLTFFSSFVTLHIYSSILYPSTKCWTSGQINPRFEKILDHPFNDRSTRCIWSAFDMPRSPFVSIYSNNLISEWWFTSEYLLIKILKLWVKRKWAGSAAGRCVVVDASSFFAVLVSRTRYFSGGILATDWPLFLNWNIWAMIPCPHICAPLSVTRTPVYANSAH